MVIKNTLKQRNQLSVLCSCGDIEHGLMRARLERSSQPSPPLLNSTVTCYSIALAYGAFYTRACYRERVLLYVHAFFFRFPLFPPYGEAAAGSGPLAASRKRPCASIDQLPVSFPAVFIPCLRSFAG